MNRNWSFHRFTSEQFVLILLSASLPIMQSFHSKRSHGSCETLEGRNPGQQRRVQNAWPGNGTHFLESELPPGIRINSALSLPKALPFSHRRCLLLPDNRQLFTCGGSRPPSTTTSPALLSCFGAGGGGNCPRRGTVVSLRRRRCSSPHSTPPNASQAERAVAPGARALTGFHRNPRRDPYGRGRHGCRCARRPALHGRQLLRELSFPPRRPRLRAALPTRQVTSFKSPRPGRSGLRS
jgi:hypothetical protein